MASKKQTATLEGRVIGLTGNPGAGKSTVAQWLKEKGAYIISGDELGYQMLEKDSPAYDRLLETFGREILDQESRIDRKKLARIVFQSDAHLKKLNDIVHPHMLECLQQEIEQYRNEKHSKYFVFDAALIFEWKIENWFDVILLIAAPLERRRERFIAMRGSESHFEKRESAQLPQSVKMKKTNLILYNDQSIQHLRKQFEQLFKG